MFVFVIVDIVVHAHAFLTIANKQEEIGTE